MAVTVPIMTIPRWAEHISVELDGDTLVLDGDGRFAQPVPSKKLAPEQDFLRQYTEFAKLSSGKRARTKPPHIQFANCKSDRELIEFVRHFGPVQATRMISSPSGSRILAYQSVAGLRRDRQIFSGAAGLVAELGRPHLPKSDQCAQSLIHIIQAALLPGPGLEIHKTPDFSQNAWYGHQILQFGNWLYQKEGWTRRKDLDWAAFQAVTSKKLQEYGRIVLCILFNSFPPRLVPTADRLQELPAYDVTSILPTLYFMLRQDYLHDKGIATCSRTGCGAFFAVERYGQRFCSADCSQLQRQRDYWQQKGSVRRKERIAARRLQEVS